MRSFSSSTSTPSGGGSSRRSPRGRGRGSASGCSSTPWGRGGGSRGPAGPPRGPGGAGRRLWIETPYFVPDDGIGPALRNAALRGVDVRLIVPGTSDLRIVSLAGRASFHQVRAGGGRVFPSPAEHTH